MGWYQCCCRGTIALCTHCTSPIPGIATVTCAGVADSSCCSECELFNGTTNLPLNTTHPDACDWFLDFAQTCPGAVAGICGSTGLGRWSVLLLNGPPKFLRASAGNVGYGSIAEYQATVTASGTAFDCATVLPSTTWTLSRTFTQTDCTNWPATITVAFST